MEQNSKLEKLKTKIEKQEKRVREEREILDELEIEYSSKVITPQAQALIGKYFKYRNNWSCPEDEDDYWYVYTRVKGFKAEGKYNEPVLICDQVAVIPKPLNDSKVSIGADVELDISSHHLIEVTTKKEFDDTVSEINEIVSKFKV